MLAGPPDQLGAVGPVTQGKGRKAAVQTGAALRCGCAPKAGQGPFSPKIRTPHYFPLYILPLVSYYVGAVFGAVCYWTSNGPSRCRGGKKLPRRNMAGAGRMSQSQLVRALAEACGT